MEYEIVRKVFENEDPESIFEVGCGPGGLLKDYYNFKKVVVGGFDINPADLLVARSVFPEYADNFIVQDARGLPWPIRDKRYDISFSIGTLILLLDPIPVVQEMLRIGKKVILAEPNGNEAVEVVSESTEYGYGKRYTHDYEKVFRDLGVPITITETNLGKHIIKTCL